MKPGLGIEPGTHWWEASALTTVISVSLFFLLRLVVMAVGGRNESDIETC